MKSINSTLFLSTTKGSATSKQIFKLADLAILTAFWIAKDMRAKLILISVPSLALLQQTLKVWIKEFLLNQVKLKSVVLIYH